MRSHVLLAGVVALSFAILVGCNSAKKPTASAQQPASAPGTVGPETTYADGVRRVTPVELKTLMEKNQAFVVDVRNQASWDAGHIPGSKMIPSTEILNHLNELPKDKLIVTYCS
jgi:3-mercaptopyruvate sulfurtransferase SseA